MLHRSSKTGQKLDVAGLNEITVLVDRSETELTEVAMNSWCPNLDGPPHAHEQKEQNFFVTAGKGTVRIGPAVYSAAPGDFFYVPANALHQTVNQGSERLEYFLFNAFLDAGKEGHASFADHISKVKETRRSQAASQQAEVAGAAAPGKDLAGKQVTVRPGTTPAVFLSRSETRRCEAVHHDLAPRAATSLGDPTKEQVLYFLAGAGKCVSGASTVTVKAGDVIYLKRDETAKLEAGEAGLRAISFGTILAATAR